MGVPLTRAQKADLAYELMDATELIASRHSGAELADSLNGVPWSAIAAQLAIWLARLPGERWHRGLPLIGDENA